MKAANCQSPEDWRRSSAYLFCCVYMCVCGFEMCTHLFAVRSTYTVGMCSAHIIANSCLCSRSAVAKLPFPVAHVSAIGALLTTNISLTSAAFLSVCHLVHHRLLSLFCLYARFGSISFILAPLDVGLLDSLCACQRQTGISLHICRVLNSLETCMLCDCFGFACSFILLSLSVIVQLMHMHTNTLLFMYICMYGKFVHVCLQVSLLKRSSTSYYKSAKSSACHEHVPLPTISAILATPSYWHTFLCKSI